MAGLVTLSLPEDQHDFIVNTLGDRRQNLVDTMKTLSSDSGWYKECAEEIERIDKTITTLALKAIEEGRFFAGESANPSIDERVKNLEEKVKQVELFRMEEDAIAKLRSSLAHEKWSNRSKTIRHNKLIKDFHLLLDEITARKEHCLKEHSCCFAVS